MVGHMFIVFVCGKRNWRVHLGAMFTTLLIGAGANSLCRRGESQAMEGVACTNMHEHALTCTNMHMPGLRSDAFREAQVTTQTGF